MTPLLLHGPAINSSRAKLSSIKKGFDPLDVVIFDGEFDMEQALASLTTLPLLSNDRLIILENPPEDFIFYTLTPIPHTLALWFDHEVSEKKLVMEWVKKNGRVLYFPEAKEVSVFPFLDMLADRDKKAFLEMDKLKKASYDGQYLIAMIFYLLRSLVAPKKTAPKFVQDKLAKQQKNFTPEVVEEMYKFVLETDFKIKSGFLDETQAEFLLVNLFLH